MHFDRESRLCAVHRDHGEDMVPASCYQFPRRALIDDRGTFVTLSNFCPTAATLLCEHEEPVSIVQSPAAFADERVYEGLDARGQWPPLVKPGLLFDLESYSRWELFIVGTLAGETSLTGAFSRIAQAAERIRSWTPACGEFNACTVRAIETRSTDSMAPDIYARLRTADVYETLRRFVPEGLTPPPSPPGTSAALEGDWGVETQAVRRYLASKAFGSWSAYEGYGIRTLIAELMVSELVLKVEWERACGKTRPSLARQPMIEAIRQSDLFLIHLIDRPQMIAWLGEVESR
jgi:hypothetical protein